MAVEALVGAQQAVKHMQDCMSIAEKLLANYTSAKVEQQIIKDRFVYVHTCIKRAQARIAVVSHLEIKQMSMALVEKVRLQMPHACMKTVYKPIFWILIVCTCTCMSKDQCVCSCDAS